ncbi:MAG: MarR family transcriptional regulator [Variovorax sp.]|nr:MarR family transcriptional regulator [Variovorax sp.]
MTSPSPDAAPLAIRLRAALSQLNRELQAGMPPSTLGRAALSALGQLHRFGPLTPTQLAGHEGVRLQTLTRLLAELEADGRITRRPHPQDGRQTVLALSARGAREITREVRRREAVLAAAIEGGFDDAERSVLLSACTLLERLGEELHPKAPSETTEAKRTLGIAR